MLWEIRALMKPALAIIDKIPDIHRTPALAVLRRAVLEGRPPTFQLADEERELTFHNAHVELTSPIGARVLRSLYFGGHLKLKKPAARTLPALEAYIATEATFRAEVARILTADATRRLRLADIIADPALALPDELTTALIDKVVSARLGHAATGSVEIAGLTCHRERVTDTGSTDGRRRDEAKFFCWWTGADGTRHGDFR